MVDLEKRLPASPYLLIPLFILLATIPWMEYGFHYYDMGWNLTKAWMIIEHPEAAFWELSWLSSLLSGLWMKVGTYSVIWLRVGYVILSIINFTLLYRILRTHYEERESMIALIPVYLMYTAGFDMFLPSYYTIPLMFAFGSILAYLRAMRQTDRAQRIGFLMVAGLLFALLIQSRYPSAALGLLFPVLGLIRGRMTGEPGSVWIRDFCYFTLSIILGTVLIALGLQAAGYLDVAYYGVSRVILETTTYGANDNIHHPARLLSDTVIRYGKVAGVGGILMIAAYLFDLVAGRDAMQPRRRVLLVVLGVACAVATIYLALNGLGMYPTSFGIVFFLYLISVRRSWVEKERDPEKWLLYIIAISFMLLMNLGSSNPQVSSFKFTIVILSGVALIETQRRSFGRIPVRTLLVILLVNITALWLSTRTIPFFHADRSESEFRVEGLQGMKDEPWMTEEVETVVGYLKDNGLQSGDTTLFYVDIPILHFVTKTIPALVNPWVSNQSFGYPSYSSTKKILAQMEASASLPKFVVRAEGIYVPHTITVPKIRMLDSLWESKRYDTVVVMKRMVVLKRPY